MTHDEAVSDLKIMIEAAKKDEPISETALENLLKYIEQFKQRPEHCRSIALDEAWSRLNLIIQEPQIPITSGDVAALKVIRDHMLAQQEKLDSQAKSLTVLLDQATAIRQRLESKAQDLLKEIYRL